MKGMFTKIIRLGVLRVKKYKKPAFGIVFCAVFLCALVAVFFLNSPKQEIKEPPLPVSCYYYKNYWTLSDMSDTIFPDKESLESLTSQYLEKIEELSDCGGWWKEINPQAEELQITYYMQDTIVCTTGIPTAFGEDAVAVNITLSMNMSQKDACLAHELGHVVLNNCFSISLEDGMCEYLNEQISPYFISNRMGIPFQDLFCLDIQYGIENNKIGQAELEQYKTEIPVGKEGRAYPYARNSSDGKMWYSASLSFVSYLIDTYGLSDVVELIRKGETQADYEKYLGHSLEELKDDWWDYVINYQSEYSIGDVSGGA